LKDEDANDGGGGGGGDSSYFISAMFI